MKEALAMLWTAVVLTVITLMAVVACGGQASAQEIPRAAESMRRDLVREARSAFGLDAPISTFAAQIHQESLWRHDAVSWVGARGLAQFMPATAAWVSEVYPYLGAANPNNPKWAIRAMVRYNRHLWDEVGGFGGDDCQAIAYVLSAYNGGARWTKRRVLMSMKPHICLGETCEINPGIRDDNQRQNAEYSRRILLEIEPKYLLAGWGRASCWVMP